MDYNILNGTLTIRLNHELYSESVLYQCFYWYSKDFDVSISKDASNYLVSIVKKNDVGLDELLISRIKQDLIDFKLRDIVRLETQTIRELITAKAFAYYDTDINPTTEVSDPVGFNPDALL